MDWWVASSTLIWCESIMARLLYSLSSSCTVLFVSITKMLTVSRKLAATNINKGMPQRSVSQKEDYYSGKKGGMNVVKHGSEAAR